MLYTVVCAIAIYIRADISTHWYRIFQCTVGYLLRNQVAYLSRPRYQEKSCAYQYIQHSAMMINRELPMRYDGWRYERAEYYAFPSRTLIVNGVNLALVLTLYSSTAGMFKLPIVSSWTALAASSPMRYAGDTNCSHRTNLSVGPLQFLNLAC